MSTLRTSKQKKLSATYDRGPAKYFHGREDVFENFDELAKDAKEVKGGSTFIVQGPPGVGKTALLYECAKRAEKNGWHIAKINSGALWDKEQMFRALGFWSLPRLQELSLELSLHQLVQGSVSFSNPDREETIQGLVEKRNKPLLLILDEAQHLSTARDHPVERFEKVRALLDSIHNGKMGKPVVLLAAGLAGTEEAFGEMGISRISKRYFVELEPLEKEAERKVIRDYLISDGGVKGDPSEWIKAIENRTHGWPEHIVTYGDAAQDILRKNRGQMTTDGLSAVLQRGRQGRIHYYQRRAKGLLKKHRVCLAEVIKDVPVGFPVDIDLVESSLRENFGESKAEELVKRIQQKGILDERNGEYFIPIPSMHTWLVETYAVKREQTLHSADQHGLDSLAKTLGMPRETIDAQLPPRKILVETNPSVSSKEQGEKLPDQGQGWER